MSSAAPAQLGLPLHAHEPLERKPFVEAPSNGDAVTRVLHGAWPLGALALAGDAGAGKSHLAAIWAARNGARRLESGAPDAAGSVPLAPVLAEDADRAMGDPAFEEALFHALNRAAQGLGGPLLLTARTAPVQWPCTLADLRSRLNALPVATLREPDDALLRALLVSFFREKSVKPSDDLLGYLVRRIERSATGAAAAVEALDAAAQGGGRVGLRLARELLDGAETQELPFERG